MAVIIAALAVLGTAGAKPRAISLDTCADQFLLALADNDQIIAVSPLAQENDSFMRERAKQFPKARPVIEDLLPREPDLVLRFWGGTPRLSEKLGDLSVPVVTLDYVSDFEGIKTNIRTAANALEQEEKGDAMIAALDRRLASLANRPAAPKAAMYVTPGGVTAGANTMIDSIFQAARVKNAATEAGVSYWKTLPAEMLVLDPPSVIIAGFFNADRDRVSNWSMVRHPVLRKLFAETPTIELDADLLACPAWFSVNAAEQIAREFDKMDARNAH